MSNPLMGGSMPNMNLMQMLTRLKSNPMDVLRQAGFNVPHNVSDPRAIIQHLMNSGQVSQQQINNAQSMAQNFGLMR